MGREGHEPRAEHLGEGSLYVAEFQGDESSKFQPGHCEYMLIKLEW